MKKILGISLVALFAVSPMMANAAAGDVNKDPSAAAANADVTTNVSPKFALQAADTATDGYSASAGYVKGAYNAAIKAVNKVYDDLDTKITSATLEAGSAIDIDEENHINVVVDDSTISIGDSGVQIKDGGVDTTQLAASAVTTAKIADSAVTTLKIDDSAVTTAKIADSAVTTLKIDDSAVTFAKIDSTAVSSSISSASTNTELATAKAVQDAIDDLGMGNYATKEGTVATINNASVKIMQEWGSTSVSSTAVSVAAYSASAPAAQQTEP